jgi:membrane protease YdiL (CAAX protease family)
MARRELPEALQVPWGIRDVMIFLLAWIGSQVLVSIALVVASRSVPVVNDFMVQAKDGDIIPAIVFSVMAAALGFGIVALFLRQYQVGWPAVGWRPVSLWTIVKYVAVIMLVFFVLVGVALAVAKLVPGFNANQPQTNDITKGAGAHPNLALFGLVLLPPIIEETIFRGFIFPAISKRTGVIWGAILSSLLFGAFHGQANVFVYTTILGLLLCFMYVRTKSIIPGMVLHMLNNFLAFYFMSK